MRAAIVRQLRQPILIEEIPAPEPGYGEVLVRMKACGICHSDLHSLRGDTPVPPKLPLIPGHEGVGEIVKLGEGVRQLSLGDRVGIPWLYSACGECDECLSGFESLCPHQLNSGHTINGGFAEYCVARAAYVTKIPDNLSYEEAAPLFCAGVASYKALKVSGAKAGEWVVIFGIGGLGHIAVQYAKAMGMRVAAVDVQEEKLALARQLGADMTINGRLVDPAAELQRQIGGALAVVCVAVNKTASQQAYQSLRRNGTLVLVGMPSESLSVPIAHMVANNLTIRGNNGANRKDMREALAFASRGQVKAVIETHPLECVNELLDRLEKGDIQGRAVLVMDAGGLPGDGREEP